MIWRLAGARVRATRRRHEEASWTSWSRLLPIVALGIALVFKSRLEERWLIERPPHTPAIDDTGVVVSTVRLGEDLGACPA
jgi:hypothetical protein